MLLVNYRKHFFKELHHTHDEKEIESFFYILIAHFFNLKRVDLVMQPEFEVTESDLQKINTVLEALKLEKPIQYCIGQAWFYDLIFEVNPSTLIPRPETEELVAMICEFIDKKKATLSILDIGTGSGCIPIALKKNNPTASVFAIDISEHALEVAERNAKLNNVAVSFIQTDILELKTITNLKTIATSFPLHFDIIVSNPPYVRQLEKTEINKNVLDYEPHLALFVSDENPLLFYKKIGELAYENLTESGALFFEINQYLGTETVALLKEIGFQDVTLYQDLYGNDRMLRCLK
jgi:release factor glutamine methyltransferase